MGCQPFSVVNGASPSCMLAILGLPLTMCWNKLVDSVWLMAVAHIENLGDLSHDHRRTADYGRNTDGGLHRAAAERSKAPRLTAGHSARSGTNLPEVPRGDPAARYATAAALAEDVVATKAFAMIAQFARGPLA